MFRTEKGGEMESLAEHLDIWVMGRTEEVMANILRLTHQSEDKLLPIMANVFSQIEGMLHLISRFDFFENIELNQSPAQEAEKIIWKFSLESSDPIATLEEVAVECAIGWCDYLFEFIGLLMIGAEKAMSNLPETGTVTLSQNNDSDEIDDEEEGANTGVT